MRTLSSFVATLFAVSVTVAACVGDDSTPEGQPDDEGPTAEATSAIGPWSDCSTEYQAAFISATSIHAALDGILTVKGPAWKALCNADQACQAKVVAVATNIITARGHLEKSRQRHGELNTIMVDWANAANIFNLGAAGQVVAGMFIGPLAKDTVRVQVLSGSVLYANAYSLRDLDLAIGAAVGSPEIEIPVRDTLLPVVALVETYSMVPSNAHVICVESEMAQMNAIAAQRVAAGPGPFGGFNPPVPPGPPPAPDGEQPPGEGESPGLPPPPPYDPYAPTFGPTNPWEGMPPVTFDFSAPPLNDAVYAMHRCEGASSCGPIQTHPSCPAAAEGGYDCQEWASYRQVWFTYSLPADVPNSPQIESLVDDTCPSKNEGDICDTGTGLPARCRNGACVVVPADTPICAGAAGYGPYPAEYYVRYSCDAQECPPGQCLAVATQNATYQYTLAYPAIVECDRLTPQGYANGIVFAGETIGCRVTLRTDGPPNQAGQQRSQQFKVIHADVREAYSNNVALHIEQTFNVIWNSEVPPGNCYSWDEYESKWLYTPQICAGCDGVPNSGLVFDACGVCGGDGSTC
ncbi:MAG: hypothetical protein IPK82_26615 [Polyangiaceae bacterium]|nr:hypothetical protein [Polyangiaceae bacterium]